MRRPHRRKESELSDLARTRAAVAALAVLLAACGGATAAPPSGSTAGAAVAPAAAATSPTTQDLDESMTFIVSSGSTATVRVREQLANVRAPNDAILSTSSVSGRFTLLPDDGFSGDSQISVNLSTLASDSNQPTRPSSAARCRRTATRPRRSSRPA